MRRRVGQQSIRGRRGALGGASAAAVCLGAALAACAGGGGGAGDGYVAVQRPSSSAAAAAPTGDVELVPLEGASAAKEAADTGSSAPDGTRSSEGEGENAGAGGDRGDGDGTGPSVSDSSGAQGSGRTNPSADQSGTADADGAGNTGGAGGSSGAGEPSGSVSSPATPAGPAVLVVGDPERKPADERWCDKVTVEFHNTGGTAVRSGTVTFGTHVIGALGIDWATVESAVRLPVPIAPGSREKKTWTVCVDTAGVPPWTTVPLGMHVETRDVSVRWK
ncbi:hypothetical protein [Streptomyces aurantiacus]|uniref:hypothetical protein n=2 Tax=Streptomyces aurantiacus TaxID=47760 RepID=UPI0033C89878